jgi:hypothetical protein
VSPESVVEHLLAQCTVRVDIGDAPQGTAFFVAPYYAVTAAHVVAGGKAADVRMTGRAGAWEGRVEDVRPPDVNSAAIKGEPYPPPDLALIRVGRGLDHACVLLGEQQPANGTRVTAFGHSRAFAGSAARPETESFTVTGELSTADPQCTLLKLGFGQAVPGMSGSPVLNAETGEVAGLLRTSRNISTNLGAWVVPAELIRRLWPEEVGTGHDRFHEQHDSWKRARAELRRSSRPAPATPPAQGTSLSIGTITGGGPVTLITGGSFGDVSIGSPGTGPEKRSS